jgi:YD repeat-containing protein
MPGGQSDYSTDYTSGVNTPSDSSSEWQAYNTYLPDQRLDYSGIRAALDAAGVQTPDSSWLNNSAEMSPQEIAAMSQSRPVRLPDGRDAVIDFMGNITTAGTANGRHYAMMYDPQGNLIREWDYEDKNDAWKRSLAGLAMVGIGGPLGGAAGQAITGGAGTMAGTTAAELAATYGAGQGAGAAGAASAIPAAGSAAASGAGSAAAPGSVTMDSAYAGEYMLGGGTPLSGLPAAASTGLDVGALTTGALSSSVGAVPNIASPQLSDILNRFGTPGVPDVPGTGAPSTGGLPDLPKPDLDKLLTALGALALNRSGIGSDGGGGGSTGYQGGIPTLQYNRTQLNTNDPNRRPGSAGRNYFSPGTFTPAPQQLAEGGLAGLAKPKSGAEPRYLNGSTDGMADKLPAKIDGGEPAQLSHGEFVIPADVVGHLGNGNSEAGAKRLYEMMDRIRHARTGNKQQGRRVDPNKFLPG